MTISLNQKYFYNHFETNVSIEEEDQAWLQERYPIVEDFLPENEGPDIQMMNKGEPVYDLVALYGSHEIRKTKTKKEMLKISFNTPHGPLKGTVWEKGDQIPKTVELLNQGGLFEIEGSLNEFMGMKDVNINAVKPVKVASEEKLLAYLPSTDLSLTDLRNELFGYIKPLKEPHRSLALAMLDEHWAEFHIKPAAKGHHHAYIHGLLKHTVGLMRVYYQCFNISENPYSGMFHFIHFAEKQLKRAMLDNLNKEDKDKQSFRFMPWSESIDHLYNTVQNVMEANQNYDFDYDLGMVSILIHDIGKIYEYSHAGEDTAKYTRLYPTLQHEEGARPAPGAIDMDPYGKLIGHMTPAITLLLRTIEEKQIPLSVEQTMKYQHCILAHHGKMEWGTNVVAATPEAWMVHFSDFIDSRWEIDDPVD